MDGFMLLVCDDMSRNRMKKRDGLINGRALICREMRKKKCVSKNRREKRKWNERTITVLIGEGTVLRQQNP
jgi:hypothetical protein